MRAPCTWVMTSAEMDSGDAVLGQFQLASVWCHGMDIFTMILDETSQ